MTTQPVVYVIGCAAPPIFDIEQLLQILQELAGCPVRVGARLPGEEDSLPMADAVLAAPLTFNTANKWGAGINDTLALGILNELLGEHVPIVAAPCVKAALRRHPAYLNSCKLLESCRVRLLDPEYTIIRSGDYVTLDWRMVVNKLESATR